ncbi:hypothetical protein YC2023_001014 [Brassica napus]
MARDCEYMNTRLKKLAKFVLRSLKEVVRTRRLGVERILSGATARGVHDCLNLDGFLFGLMKSCRFYLALTVFLQKYMMNTEIPNYLIFLFMQTQTWNSNGTTVRGWKQLFVSRTHHRFDKIKVVIISFLHIRVLHTCTVFEENVNRHVRRRKKKTRGK